MKKILLTILLNGVILLAQAQIISSTTSLVLDEASAAVPENYEFIPADHLGLIAPVIFQSQLGGGTFNVQILLATANDGGVSLCTVVTFELPSALDVGTSIGSASNWQSGPFPNGTTAFTLFHKTISPLLTGQPGCMTSPVIAGISNKYIGLRLASNGTTVHYGWAEISINVAGDEVTVHGWAYETTPNTAIVAGDTGGAATVSVSAITVSGAGGASTITTASGTLQMSAAILPLNATDNSVTWSVTNGTGSASINGTGLLTALTDGVVTVVATANDASGITGSMDVTLSSGSVGIESLSLKSMKIYPNPSNGTLNIISDNIIQKLIVFDVVGTTIKEIYPNKLAFSFDVSSGAKGVYFLKIYTEKEVKTEKIILK